MIGRRASERLGRWCLTGLLCMVTFYGIGCTERRFHSLDHASHYGLHPGKTYEGHYKIGKPYRVKEHGPLYHPKDVTHYDKTGIASWYGPGFHRRRTANGDRFNQRALTAAHNTLPMPCLARVTNLTNGRSVIVMVNDRGPFARNRLIDVSERAAELLDFKRQGFSRVRVQYLGEETDHLLASLGLEKKEGFVANRPFSPSGRLFARRSTETVRVSSPVVAESLKPTEATGTESASATTARSKTSAATKPLWLAIRGLPTKERAIHLAAQLQSHPVTIESLRRQQGYRLVVGPFSRSDALEAMRRKVSEWGYAVAIDSP